MKFSPHAPTKLMVQRRRPAVVHLIETLGSGGAERLLYTNLKHFPATCFEHTVLTVFDGADRWAGPIRELGVNVKSLGCRDYRGLAAGAAALRSRLRATRPSLLHTHLWAANVAGRVAGRLVGVPVISSVHNPDYEPEAWADGSAVSVRKRKIFRALDRWTAHFGCDRMIAVSRYVRQSAHRHLRFPLERIELLYNPVDIDDICSPPRKDRQDLLRELSLHPASTLLLNVGRVAPQKGLLYAIRALPQIKTRFPLVQLLAAGATDDRVWLAHLRDVAKDEGVSDRVHFLGARTDIPDLLRACDLFIFPSLHEGLGIALVEAMVVGCACVATTTGPIPEVIRHGEDGWLVPPGDAAALAQAVADLLSDPGLRKTLGEKAGESTRTKFEPGRAALRLAEIYESVMQSAAPG